MAVDPVAGIESKDVSSKLACDLAALSQFAESESGASL